MASDELERLKEEYAARARRLAGSELYSPFNPAQLFILQQRQRQILRALKQAGAYPLEGRRVLEVGCGSGGVLIELLQAGAQAGRLHGVDYLAGSLRAARARCACLPLVRADGQHLPYPDGCFDLVMQFTAFSSILDDAVRARMAAEMARVLDELGVILWYDFWLNPSNRETRGIRPEEVRRLFPGCELRFRKITLAPPLVRRLVRVSWTACALLEKLGVLNTHYLVTMRKRGN